MPSKKRLQNESSCDHTSMTRRLETEIAFLHPSEILELLLSSSVVRHSVRVPSTSNINVLNLGIFQRLLPV